ncbi:interferon-induced protein 44-like [Sander vitreus]
MGIKGEKPMVWPPSSPDLNPIENLWSILKQKIYEAVSEPWRKISWGDNARDLQYVKEYKPGNDDIKHVRILLYGPDGAGKSSFISSVCSVIQGRVTTPALTSDKRSSGTYETFKIRKEEGNPETFCDFVFNDVMDLKDGDGICADDIKLTLKGHVKEGYQFKPSSPLSPEDPGYNPCPSADDKVHVLVCVLSANSAEITDSVLKKMAVIREAASELGIPQMAIGTNIDLACPETENDLKNVYKSKHLKQKGERLQRSSGSPRELHLSCEELQ